MRAGGEREPSLIIDEKTCMITNKLYIMCPRTTCDHMSDQQWTAVGMARKKNYKFFIMFIIFQKHKKQ